MMSAAAPFFELTEASFGVPGRTLLHATSTCFQARRMTALIGHNGSGKSTLLKLLARQHTPTGGSIAMDGRALQTWRMREFACQVAYLPQHLPMDNGLTVAELVALGRYPWRGMLGRYDDDDRRAISEAMHMTDVGGMADELVAHLSGGERQRCWLAMLVAQRAQCLLLDEPTSALDIGHQLDVLQLLRQLCDRHKLTVIVVLHDINLAARYCDTIVALREGHHFITGTPAEIMNSDTLEAVYGLPMAVMAHPTNGLPMAFAR